ncbi:MAG: phosphatase PAP2 family protein [Bacilli bacterium]|nr:phosphatase PAP2 family protein [Bacilli bacterium]
MKKFIKENKLFIKSIIITLLLQAINYFLIGNLVSDYKILETNINFPLIKWFIYIYNSWYPFVILTSYLIYKNNVDLYKKLIFTMLLSFLLADLTFIIYPTGVIRPEFPTLTITDFVINTTYYLDNPPINCLPSLHALVCYLLIYYINKTKYKTISKISIIIYLILIILSTLFTHQHILIDLIFALIYLIIAMIIIKLLYPKLKETLKFIF